MICLLYFSIHSTQSKSTPPGKRQRRQLNITSTFGWSLFAECQSEVGDLFKNKFNYFLYENIGLFSWF